MPVQDEAPMAEVGTRDQAGETAEGGAGTAVVPDRAGIRLFVLVGGVILALIAGFGLGRSLGPLDSTSGGRASVPMPGMPSGAAVAADGHVHGPTTGNVPSVADQVGGLALSSGGYTLVPALQSGGVLPSGSPFQFRVEGPDRKPVTNFAVVHDKTMHLIVVRRDLSGYRHLHPTMAPDGTWGIDLRLPEPGVWRAYADFAAIGANGAQVAVTLGTDLTVPGAYQPRALAAPSREASVADFAVTYEGTPQVGVTRPFLFRVFAAGQPVTNLERYLGAFGHLVVVREGDLGYVHVHPENVLVGGAVKFWMAAPSPGRYRMFFDFQVAGQVHTGEYTLVIS
jgi:hypothetical protein